MLHANRQNEKKKKLFNLKLKKCEHVIYYMCNMNVNNII